jgi:hypothetical protein
VNTSRLLNPEIYETASNIEEYKVDPIYNRYGGDVYLKVFLKKLEENGLIYHYKVTGFTTAILL